ncbi:Nin one binding Zn-ribbon like-domain-containing protein [Cristinia sonorae]|uniref:Nin one binding Zn-ribbon like-domain-containing protein n=1 Tax=Cristinia sonorae TaxID=1940300 RepID=A0A8K0UKW2_9AGAR|nr:Nin one binding Zn-ribbon like-domain-containing protein [Cristinia sonorae]
MTSQAEQNKPACKILVLDAGPLLSLAPLRGLAEIFYTVPQVLEELKDKRARDHFRQLGLSAGVRIEVKAPDAGSLSHVINFAKKTGDYSVLSHADLCILALTHALNKERAEAGGIADEVGVDLQLLLVAEPVAGPSASRGSKETLENTEPTVLMDTEDLPAAEETDAEEPPPSEDPSEDEVEDNTDDIPLDPGEDEEEEKLDVELQRIAPEVRESPSSPHTDSISPIDPPSEIAREDDAPIYDDPSDEDDGEGEWITPSNVSLHKSRAMKLLPGDDAKAKKGPVKQIEVGCMTADFAMQNVLLQMGLSLVGVEGKRIEKVKTWVLRCHACFKICKDNARKFCPSCGNPTLLRASVTLSSPTATSATPTLQVHLKKNFQYKTRGTIFSIPAPKPGTAKTGSGEGLILREDQTDYMRAQKRVEGKREREEKKMLNGALHGKSDTAGVVISSWMDPDWVPEILSTGTGGKGRSMKARGMDGDLPMIGYGKKNPNERKRRSCNVWMMAWCTREIINASSFAQSYPKLLFMNRLFWNDIHHLLGFPDEIRVAGDGEVINGESIQGLACFKLRRPSSRLPKFLQAIGNIKNEDDEETVCGTFDLKVSEEGVGTEEVECFVDNVGTIGIG